ncbi:hypothetical protein ACIRRH_35670 [Kitasatospora sp. NPDC101235]|uniref:hypothetical protein n=1 Tax=Kitasatospora sp. NPDC101235 TaxID=3364101 RepID=UPI0037FBA6AA
MTITTTARIAALRQRAVQAETAQAETAHRLEEALEEQRIRDLELLTVRADLKTALAKPERTLVAEAKASEAVTRLLMKEASAQLAARDRTIAELRAELEQARAGRPADPALPEHAVLAFRTLGGGLVALMAVPDEDSYDRRPSYGYACLTCGDEATGPSGWRTAAGGANEHAGECRAIPAGTTDAGKAGTRS